MASVVGAECLFAYLWLPSEAQVAAQMEQIAAEANEKAREKEGNHEEKEVLEIEVDLGGFTITNHRLQSESTIRTDFHLYGTVDESEAEEFRELYARNEKRLRDQIIMEIRNCDVTDLEDAGLGLIKRRFLKISNSLLGKPLLREIIFTDYTFVEL
jgi:flagellar FliL protein